MIHKILRKTSPPIRQYGPAGSHSIPQAKDTTFNNQPQFTHGNWHLQSWFTKILRYTIVLLPCTMFIMLKLIILASLWKAGHSTAPWTITIYSYSLSLFITHKLQQAMCWMTSIQFPVQGGIFPVSTIPTLALGPTHSAILSALVVLSPAVKQPQYKTEHIPSFSAKVKNTEPYLHSPMALCLTL
jgi:hypothetical protein